jgi:hypothetical protein
MIIGGYYISDYFINGYWWLNYHKLLMSIGGYSISGYHKLFYCRPLVAILLVAIDDY